MDRSPAPDKRFGRIDPFAWIPVVSLVTIAALMFSTGAPWFLGGGFVLVAGLLLLFDSWVNRPGQEAQARRPRPELAGRPLQPQPEDNRARPPRAGAEPP